MPISPQNIPMEFTIDHVAVSVSNLNKSVDFYTKILGFKCERIIEMPEGNGKVALLQKPDFNLEMFQITGCANQYIGNKLTKHIGNTFLI
jgi:catechol 2,3-dioxygenase-like lactoylglutathione lyase family enzyme